MPDQEAEFSFKSLFVPLTTLKAIHFIVIVGIIVFFNMLFNGFVWDDKTYILNNEEVHSVNIPLILTENSFNSAGQYRPIPTLYFSILYSIFGQSQFFYHLIQLIIHIINAVLIYFLFKKFFHKLLSFFSALIFLVHPVQIESVSYIAASDNPLFFLFGLIALLLSLKSSFSIKRLIAINLLLLLSLLTKETGIIFIFIVLFYKLLFNKKEFFVFLSGGVLTVLTYLFIRIFIGGVFFLKIIVAPIARLSLIERLINVPSIALYYLKTFLFPLHLIIDQQWVITKIDMHSFYLPLLIILTIIVLAFYFVRYVWVVNRKSAKMLLFFVFWSVLGLCMHLQIFPLDETVADRWFYLPVVGFIGVIAFGTQFSENVFISINKKIVYFFAAILILLLSIKTVTRNADWRDAITLYTFDSAVLDNFEIEQNLAIEYWSLQNYSDSLKHYKASVALFPNEANLSAIGNIYEQLGNYQDAIDYYNKALQSRIYLPIKHKHILLSYINFAEILILDGKLDNAKKIIESGLFDYPDSIQLWCELAIAEYSLNDYDNALKTAGKTEMIYPSNGTNYIYTQIQNKQPIQIAKNSGIIGWINNSMSGSVTLSR